MIRLARACPLWRTVKHIFVSAVAWQTNIGEPQSWRGYQTIIFTTKDCLSYNKCSLSNFLVSKLDFENANLRSDQMTLPPKLVLGRPSHVSGHRPTYLDLCSPRGKGYFILISCILEATIYMFHVGRSFCNLTDVSAALLPRRLSNIRMILSCWHPISRLRDLARSNDKMSVRLVNKGPGPRTALCPVSRASNWEVSVWTRPEWGRGTD